VGWSCDRRFEGSGKEMKVLRVKQVEDFVSLEFVKLERIDGWG
jgi:hypothetical protein